MKNIKKMREKANLTQKQLADMLHYDRSAVSKWECEGFYPRAKILTKLAEIFGCTVDDLLKPEKNTA